MTSHEGRFSYDTIAAEYASKVDSAPFNALYERPAMLGMLPPVEGDRILDAGCGSGWYAEQLLARGAIVAAVDASAAMVEYARERFSRLPSSERERVAVQVADLDRPLPFDDRAFSGVLSPLVLHYIRDWRPAMREMNRVLQPGGLLYTLSLLSLELQLLVSGWRPPYGRGPTETLTVFIADMAAKGSAGACRP